jgi:hypothetical protein
MKSRVNIILLPLFVGTLLHVVVATGQWADSITDADRVFAQVEAQFTGYAEAIDILKDRGIMLADGDVDKKYDDSAAAPLQLSTDGRTHGETTQNETMQSIPGQEEVSQEREQRIVKDLFLAVLDYVTRKRENDSILLALFKRGASYAGE